MIQQPIAAQMRERYAELALLSQRTLRGGRAARSVGRVFWDTQHTARLVMPSQGGLAYRRRRGGHSRLAPIFEVKLTFATAFKKMR